MKSQTQNGMLTMLLVFLVLSLALSIHAIDNSHSRQEHRVFPAATFERFAADDDTLLRVLDPDTFDILDDNDNKQVKEILQAAKERFLQSTFYLPDYTDSYTKNENATLVPLQRLVLTLSSNSTELQHGVDESYSLSIENTTCNVAFLNATTVYGIVRGLETLAQLLQFAYFNQDNNKKKPIYSLPASFFIADQPTYSHRGLLIDTSRHYLPLSLIVHNLDAMCMNKLNVLHWHITDSPSFPYQSLHYPELANKGAYSPNQVYTIDNVQLVVKQAKLRGIRVVVELDLPGHSQAISKSHPEIMSHCPNPSEPLDPTLPQVYTFIANLYSELIHLFPDDFIHVGGDEVNLDCWKNSTTIQDWIKRHPFIHNETQLFGYFETKLLKMVTNKFHKTPIVWQEVFHLGLPLSNTTIVNVWKSSDTTTIAQATLQNYSVLVSKCWYLDHLDQDWYDFYTCHPRNYTPPDKSHFILGGHASMWGETVDATNFMSRVWPRASSMAEILWSGNSASAKRNIRQRMTNFRCHMVARGIAAQPIAPGCCEVEPKYVHGMMMPQQQQDHTSAR